MSVVNIHKPKTVGELRKALANIPDDMPLYLAGEGGWLSTVRVFEGRAGKAKPKKVVYRGGDSALFVE